MECGDEVFHEEEMNELQVLLSDALFFATRSGEDASHGEYYLFDDEQDIESDEETPYAPNTNLHHDVLLHSIPLCTTYTSLADKNLVPVGYVTPSIDVWEVDSVPRNHLVAICAPLRRRSRAAPESPYFTLQADSHKDFVM